MRDNSSGPARIPLAVASTGRYTAAMPDSKQPISMIDLATDRRTRSATFILRLVASVFFVSIFGGIPIVLRRSEGFDPFYLWDFAIAGAPALLSFLVMGIVVYFVILIHELIHYVMLRMNGARDIAFRIDRITPRASAPEWYLRRGSAFIYAISPFMALSLIGMVLLLTVPQWFIAWIFIPTVANGVFSAADFVVVAWLGGVPRDGLVVIVHEGAIAFSSR